MGWGRGRKGSTLVLVLARGTLILVLVRGQRYPGPGPRWGAGWGQGKDNLSWSCSWPRAEQGTLVLAGYPLPSEDKLKTLPSLVLRTQEVIIFVFGYNKYQTAVHPLVCSSSYNKEHERVDRSSLGLLKQGEYFQ